ncbi:MAG: hypothetical protein ACYSTL_08425, partial [Planctomycetota bacterium]
MGLVAGIDEAGLGPVLGPLVVSGAAFEVPDELVEVSMWEALQAGVSRKASRRGGKVAISDSKKLYTSRTPKALAHLERAVLGMLATQGAAPQTVQQLLSKIAPGSLERMGRYPWYACDDLPLPRCITATDARLAGNSLATVMKTARIRLIGIRCEII